MKTVPLLLFVGILVFSSARKHDPEEFLNSLDEQEADAFRRALEEHLANDIDVGAEQNDDAALERVRALIAANADVDDDDIHDVHSRGWWGSVEEFFTDTLPGAIEDLYNTVNSGVNDIWDDVTDYLNDLTKAGIAGINNAIDALEEEWEDVKDEVENASGSARDTIISEGNAILDDITDKINTLKSTRNANCKKMSCSSPQDCMNNFGCRCIWFWGHKWCY